MNPLFSMLLCSTGILVVYLQDPMIGIGVFLMLAGYMIFDLE